MNSLMAALLETSVYAAVLIAAILVFRRLFGKRISCALRYGMWFLLIFRLLLPVTIESGIHLVSSAPASAQAPITTGRPESAGQPESSDRHVYEPADTPALPVDEGAPAPLAKAVPPISLWTIAASIWTAGVCLSALRLLTGAVSIHRLSKKGGADAPAHVLAALEACKAALHIEKDIRLLVREGEFSPALLPGGAILLPFSITHDGMRLKCALMHELCHFKRRDPLVLVLIAALKCVYWFHPLVRFALGEMCADMEAVCDAAATARMRLPEKKEYFTMILELFSRNSLPAPGMAWSSERSVRRAAHKRVQAAALPARSAQAARTCAVCILPLMLLLCFTTACQPAPVKNVVLARSTEYSPAPANMTERPVSAPVGRIEQETALAVPERDAGQAEATGQMVNHTGTIAHTAQSSRRVDEPTSAEDASVSSAKGQTGISVVRVQAQLRILGFMDKVTGYYGSETTAAVKRFQAQSGLMPDGIAGSATKECLRLAVEKAGYTEEAIEVEGLLSFSRTLAGKPYVRGSSGPRSFDCAGFVYYCLTNCGVDVPLLLAGEWPDADFPSITQISDVAAGDILCFNGHVAIYIGDGEMIDASSASGKVVVRKFQPSTYFTRNFLMAKRVF